MKILGLIVEYNPFHTGHLYHLEKAQELVQPDLTVVIMSGNFVQRGEPAIIDKWTRSAIALDHAIDLVVELPFVYAVQSADYFASGAMKILHDLHVTDVVFGSESGDITSFEAIAKTLQEKEDDYNQKVKEYMKQGYRYPNACNQAIASLSHTSVTTPNDILGLTYVKENLVHNYQIRMHCIKRTNDFHATKKQRISSATALRLAIQKNEDVSNQVPSYQHYQHPIFLEQLFPYLKYKILTTTTHDLQQLHLVEEGLENVLKKHIGNVDSMSALIQQVTSKRYTQGRIQRMLIHIALNNTKDSVKQAVPVDYIRILGMNKIGQAYLHSIKKTNVVPCITTFSSHQHPALTLEMQAAYVYGCLCKNPNAAIKKEYSQIPIIKNR